MFKAKLKIILYPGLIILIILILAVLSEILYSTKNDPLLLRRFLVAKSLSYAKKDSSYLALKYLHLSAGFRLNYESHKYSDVVSNADFNSYSKKVLSSNYDKSKYLDYLKTLDTNTIFGSNDFDLLRIYYNLALIADQNDYIDDVLPFIKTAMYLQPELSHIHIELANYYLLNNNPEAAKVQIDNCLTILSPSYHCSIYKQSQLDNPTVSKIGFLKESIDQQYR